ncbi:MAG: acyltransferase family protein [Solirubrobacterales bacterium]|nr:acyltransferase family protein [Solirubrobacterales bacterium]
MPEPVGRSQRYMPGLDGLRAVAVLAVITYHLGFGWAGGGLLGVGVFFTLSGYLITDLLLAQVASGRVDLGNFWLRRARRLLPALFLVLAVVTIWVAVADRSQLPGLRGQVGAAAVYLNNWWEIFHHIPYFARFGPPSPLNHLWSLAVEEQFYLLWPWLLLLGVRFVPERRRPLGVRPRLAGLVLALALASGAEMALLYHPSFDPSRVYDGTDTRAFGLLFGAALAMVWPSRLLTRRVRGHARTLLEVAGTVGLVTIAVLIWRTNQYSPFLYRGGMVGLSAATVLVIAAAAHPVTRLGAVLGWQPLRWLGVRSYGIYLWHAPVIVLTTSTVNRGTDLLRAAAQVAASIVLAALSWRFIEEPIRRGALGRLWAAARAGRWRPRSVPARARLGLTAAVAGVALGCVALAGISPPRAVSSTLAGISVNSAALGSSLPPPPQTPTVSFSARGGQTRTTTSPPVSKRSAAAPGPRPADPARAARTSCRSVVHLGDSTSEGMISTDYLPNPRQRLAAQYARVGVRHEDLEITGATSIVETLPGGINAYEVARGLVGGGYHGCWVIALGTNDTADVYVGSSVSLSTRIERMMSVIGDQPVLWLNVKSLLSSGPYAESNMEHWNSALLQACAQHPNMRILDWAAVVHDSWFIADGIHYTSPGYAARARLIADGLVQAFPAGGATSPAGCIVNP